MHRPIAALRKDIARVHIDIAGRRRYGKPLRKRIVHFATIYAYCEPVDMRKHWEGLSSLVREELGRDPLSGDLYLFTNKRRTLAKVLRFDGSGLCILAKRLERERFAALWNYTDRKSLPLKRSELELFLEGSHIVARFQVSPPVLTNSDLASKANKDHK